MKFKRFQLTEKHIPWILLWFVILSYGIYIFWFGFYGDDWSYIYYHHLLGFQGPGDFAATDRPLSALFYNPVVAILGESPWGYHLFLLLLRWLSAILFLQILRIIWPNQTRQVTWMAVIFAVYPGFRQQPIAVEFILHFFNYCLFLFSLLSMVWAIRSPNRYWIWGSLSIVSCAGIFMMEYFAGLELMRILLISYVLGLGEQNARKRFVGAFKYWMPYLVVLIGFIIWRVFIFKFPTYQPSLIRDLYSAPWDTAASFVQGVLGSLKAVIYSAWRITLGNFGQTDSRLPYLVIIIVGFGSSLLIFLKAKFSGLDIFMRSDSPIWKEWALQPIFLGLIMSLVGGAPFWITYIPVEASFPWDRSILPFIPGVCLFTIGVIYLFVHTRWRELLLACLVGLAVGTHYSNALVYKGEWENVRMMFWQLTWRAPGLVPGTILMSDEIPLYRVSDNGLTSPLNWTYAPDHKDRNLPYKFFDLDLRLGEEYTGLPGLEKDLPVSHNYRSLFFSSTTSNSLVFMYRLEDCIHVLSNDDATLPDLPQKIRDTLPLSNLEMIDLDANPARPPEQWGLEPSHGWCYYFEKADLARQKGDWQQIVSLGDKAFEESLSANDKIEYKPFIEGYAYIGRWQTAKDLSLQVQENEVYSESLCAIWEKINSHLIGNVDAEKPISEIMIELKCRQN